MEIERKKSTQALGGKVRAIYELRNSLAATRPLVKVVVKVYSILTSGVALVFRGWIGIGSCRDALDFLLESVWARRKKETMVWAGVHLSKGHRLESCAMQRQACIC